MDLIPGTTKKRFLLQKSETFEDEKKKNVAKKRDATEADIIMTMDGEEKKPHVTHSRQVVFKNHQYDSVLEAQWAAFFHSLEIDFIPHADRLTLDLKDYNTTGSNKSMVVDYQPDFYLPYYHIYVEIKPCFPHEGELSRVDALVRQRKISTLLLYGNFAAGLPFADENGERHYRHGGGIRGIKWEIEGKDVRRLDHVVWGCSDDDGVTIEPRGDIANDFRWKHRRIVAAVEAARKWASSWLV